MSMPPAHNSNATRANLSSIELSMEMTQLTCATAHKQCNAAMHSHPRVDDLLSGTTAILCCIHGRRNWITVCNVGDSRGEVLGKRIHRKGNNGTGSGRGNGSGSGSKTASIAEEFGVYAELEMVTRELEDGDQIIVLVSDGVFDFLTNQSVIDICAKFKDPLSASCKAVVVESYELWLQYELRTDDITMK